MHHWPAIDLVPPAHAAARRTRARARLWLGALTAYAFLVIVGIVLARAAPTDNTPTMRAIADLRTEVGSVRHAAASRAAEALRLVRRLELARALRDGPDYPALLERVASMLGDEVVLERIAIDRDATGRSVLVIDGLAAAQGGPSRLALELESSGLFAQTELKGTARRPFGTGEVVGFRVRCEIPGGAR